MGWCTVVVNTHSKLAYVNNHLIFKNAEKTERLHLSEIDVLLLETTDITITTMLLKRLVDEKILVLFLMTSDFLLLSCYRSTVDMTAVCS